MVCSGTDGTSPYLRGKQTKWYLVAASDKMIPPVATWHGTTCRFNGRRTAGSHAVYVSNGSGAKLIEQPHATRNNPVRKGQFHYYLMSLIPFYRALAEHVQHRNLSKGQPT